MQGTQSTHAHLVDHVKCWKDAATALSVQFCTGKHVGHVWVEGFHAFQRLAVLQVDTWRNYNRATLSADPGCGFHTIAPYLGPNGNHQFMICRFSDIPSFGCKVSAGMEWPLRHSVIINQAMKSQSFSTVSAQRVTFYMDHGDKQSRRKMTYGPGDSSRKSRYGPSGPNISRRNLHMGCTIRIWKLLAV